MIENGTAVALISKRETMKGRVRRPPRHGKASVYWVNRLRASSVRISYLTPIEDAELVAFFDQQAQMIRKAWQGVAEDTGRPDWVQITPPAEQPQFVQNFIRTGRDSG